MSRLEKALKARLPLVCVETDDLLNIGSVLEEIAGESIRTVQEGFSAVKEHTIHYIVEPVSLHPVKWYTQCMSVGATLVLVNPCEVHPMFFDAGELETPTEMIKDFVSDYYAGDHPEELTAALRGLSYKDIAEIAKLAMTETGALTPNAVRAVRRWYFGSVQGLEQLDTASDFYYPNSVLKNWVKSDGRFLTMEGAPKELVPRGLMFSGPSGTGKTQGAKFLARKLNLPLYVLNIGKLSSKYFSESEKNLTRCLDQAGNASPCVLLIDECEKLFDVDDEGGTMHRLLAQLLWWLQEHSAKVFTVMTTNATEKIPPELYRPGRIDKNITFARLKKGGGKLFISNLFTSLKHLHKLKVWDVTHELSETIYTGKSISYSHAELTGYVLDRIKTEY